MNKFITKIVGAALGLTMAIGVGVAVGASAKEAVPVRATTGNATAATSIVSGKKYLVTAVSNSTRYYMVPTDSETAGQVSAATISNVATATEAMCWTFTGSEASWTIANGTHYLVNTNTNNGVKTSTTSQNWTSSFDGSSLTLTGNNSRKLSLYASGPNWRCYSSASGVQSLQIYEFEAAKTLSSITLSGTYQTSFTQGDTFTNEGMVVTATYDDSSTAVVTDKVTLSGYNLSNSGTQTVTVSYTENEVTKTATYEISVAAATVYSVTDSILNGLLSSTASVRENNELDITIQADDKYDLPSSLEITMGGNELTADTDYLYDSTDGSLYIGAVTGAVVISGECTKTLGLWQDTAYTVAQAVDAIDNSGNVTNVYVAGKISQIDSYFTSYKSITYWISDDGTTTNQFEVYSGKGLNGADFAAKEDIFVGQAVVVYGNIKLYNSVYEFDKSSEIVSITNPALSSISVADYTSSFETGDAFEFGGTVTATYVGGGTADVTESATFSGYDLSSTGTQTVTVSYTENGVTKTATYQITVVAPITKYTVSFNAGEGSGTMSSVQVNENSTYELPESTFTAPSGKRFKAWKVGEEATERAVGYELTITADVTLTALYETIPTVTYRKVESTLDDFSGNYLLVYETGNVAFDGSLTTLDAVGNTISVDITNEVIELEEGHGFAIEAITGGYTVKSDSGYYIGQTSNANGMASNTSTTYTNTITYSDSDGALLASSSAVLRYNSASNQLRFRYYKSSSYSSQQSIALYMETTNIDDFVTDNMKMDQYIGDETYNEDRCTANYSAAKTAFNGLTTAERSYFVSQGTTGGQYEEEYARLLAWAEANGETIGTAGGKTNVLNSAQILGIINKGNNSYVTIIVVVSLVSLTAIGGYFFLRKRKEQ